MRPVLIVAGFVLLGSLALAGKPPKIDPMALSIVEDLCHNQNVTTPSACVQKAMSRAR